MNSYLNPLGTVLEREIDRVTGEGNADGGMITNVSCTSAGTTLKSRQFGTLYVKVTNTGLTEIYMCE